MKIDVRTPEGKPVRWQDATIPIGTALRIVPRFQVDAEDDKTGLGNRLDVEYDQGEGRYVVREIATRALDGGEITGSEMRQVRVAEILQAASPHCVAFTLDDEDVSGTGVTAADVADTDGRLLPAWLSATVTAAISDRRLTEPARSELREARLDGVQPGLA